MIHKKDLDKALLYESVKVLVESSYTHIHLSQQKLFTLYSLAFQYLLFKSIKDPGAYIIRVEDSHLAEKLSRKAKDDSTRRFMQKILLPRRLNYKNSTFYLDYFHMGSWSNTKDIPPSRIKAGLVVKNTTTRPFDEHALVDEVGEESPVMVDLPDQYYFTSLQKVAPKTIVIAFEEEFPNVEKIEFPFIKKEVKALSGVKLASDLNID